MYDVVYRKRLRMMDNNAADELLRQVKVKVR